MSPTLNGSTALQHFECGKTVEICNGIMFDFYLGLPHCEKKNDLLLYTGDTIETKGRHYQDSLRLSNEDR